MVAQTVKHLPIMQETWVRFLGWEYPLEKEMATHSSILAWRIPWTEKPGWLQSIGLQIRTHLNTHPITSYIPSYLHPSFPCNLSFDFTEKFFVPTDLPCPCFLLFLPVLHAQSSGLFSHAYPQLLHCLILLLHPFCKILTLNPFHNPLLDPMTRVLNTPGESHTAT